MIYRKLAKNGPDISLLSYGCMRFPSKGGGIDKELTFSQLKYAYDGGVNYFDTAYLYHSGKSEGILGEFIKKFDLRDKIYIADKLPAYLVTKPEQFEKFFATQLQRLDTGYIDFYLMHMLTSMPDWENLKSLGILDFINNKKKSGEVKFIGFSYHGRPEDFIKILEDYEWDFCQIQYNYIDENYQAGKAGLIRAHELEIGVSIMEPLRGGALANQAPDKVKQLFKSYKEERSPANWALRFVMNHEGVSTVLSGMNDYGHIKDNINAASVTTENSMSEEELNIIEDVKTVYKQLMKVPCTGCNYCTPCPFGVDIPLIFADYNSKYFFKGGLNGIQYIARHTGAMGEKSGVNLCTNCGKCKKHCPQNIDIPVKLKQAHKELDKPAMRIVLSVVAKFFVLKKKKKKKKKIQVK